jgi:hypothetical protein
MDAETQRPTPHNKTLEMLQSQTLKEIRSLNLDIE